MSQFDFTTENLKVLWSWLRIKNITVALQAADCLHYYFTKQIGLQIFYTHILSVINIAKLLSHAVCHETAWLYLILLKCSMSSQYVRIVSIIQFTITVSEADYTITFSCFGCSNDPCSSSLISSGKMNCSASDIARLLTTRDNNILILF